MYFDDFSDESFYFIQIYMVKHSEKTVKSSNREKDRSPQNTEEGASGVQGQRKTLIKEDSHHKWKPFFIFFPQRRM